MSIGKKWAYGLGDIVSGFSVLVLNYVDGLAGTEFQLQSGHKLEVVITDVETVHELGPAFDLSLLGKCVKVHDEPWLFKTASVVKDSIEEVLPRNLELLAMESATSIDGADWENLLDHITKKFNRDQSEVNYVVTSTTLLLNFGAYVIRIRDIV